MSEIHATAVVDKKAELDSSVEVGAYAVIGPEVKIGPETKIHNSVSIAGDTTIGQNNELFPYTSIGFQPQDKKFKGNSTKLIIGDNNILREFVSMNPGTEEGGGKTTIGSDNMFLTYSHVAHDCRVENNVIMSGGVLLAGHVRLEKGCIVSGGTCINQFVTVGRYAYIGGLTRVVQDVPPFMITEGNPQRVRSVNAVGMQRNDFSSESVQRVREAYRVLFDPDVLWSRAEETLLSRPEIMTEEVRYLLDFLRLRNGSKNGRAREALRTGS